MNVGLHAKFWCAVLHIKKAIGEDETREREGKEGRGFCAVTNFP